MASQDLEIISARTDAHPHSSCASRIHRRLLHCIARAVTPDVKARGKVMEILSHLNLMVKQRPSLALPTDALLEQVRACEDTRITLCHR